MRIAIIIPAHNEERFIAKTLESLVNQTYPASQIIVVDDHSTDQTFEIAASFEDRGVKLIRNISSDENIPGSKVIKAFNKGLQQLNLAEYDIICKYDADLIFPKNYLEVVVSRFCAAPSESLWRPRESGKAGMAAGHCSILRDNKWELENLTNPDHIRGALKAYSVECFLKIGGLKESIGWDTVDEILARYYGYKVITIPDLHVKHLKPTGTAYQTRGMQTQGEAFYKMRAGILITSIVAIKMALKQRKSKLLLDYLKGYIKAQRNQLKPIINEDQGRFLRNYRWKGIKSKIGLK